MLRWNASKWLVSSAVVVATLALSSASADAFWWRHHGSSGGSSGGYYGSYGSSGGSSGGYYGSSGGSSGGYSYGSSGGSSGGYGYRPVLWRRWWHRPYYYGSSGGSSGGYSYGSSGGSSGGYSYGSSGGSSGGWGSSGGSAGSYIIPSTPAAPMVPGAPAAQPPMLPMGTMLAPPQDSVTMNVRVPGEAKVYVNGMATTSTGNQRRYVSNGLEPGFNYTYELRAEIERDGKLVTTTKTVKVKAGDVTDVSIDFEQAQENKVASEPVNTKLTLKVPADAKVFLSGNATGSTGAVREFTTARLPAGQTWNDYVVRVEFDHNGQKLVEERKLTLNAGDERELSFDFDLAKVASK